MNAFLLNNRRYLRFHKSLQLTNKYVATTSYRLHKTEHCSRQTHTGNVCCSKPIYSSFSEPKRRGTLPLHPTVINTVHLPLWNYNAVREFRVSHILYEQPSSKVEVTVQSMKDRQKEKVEEIMKEAASKTNEQLSTSSGGPSPEPSKPKEPAKQVEPKKSLKTRVWEEVLHFYHGFRLLFIDINICRKLLWRVLHGKTLTRRENKLLVRTTSDLFRLIPFSVFIIVPFMELLLPVFIKFFPGMLPSTFQTAKDRENRLKQSLQVRLEMAKFLQKTLDEMTVQHKEHKSEEAKQFALFFQRVRDLKDHVSNEEIIKYAKRFDDEVTLDSLSREQLVALCRVLELNTIGTSNFLRFNLRLKLRHLAADDRDIAREGVNSLDLFELQSACKARGMRAYGLTAEHLRSQLQEWIDLSLNEKVPPTLLLLSRALLISDDIATTDKLKATIRVLPDSIAAQTKAAIGESEGKIDNKTKIEIIKEEERKIKEEREEEREHAKAKAEVLLDKAKTIETDKVARAAAAKPIVSGVEDKESDEEKKVIVDDKTISSKDVELLSQALKTLSSDKKMVVEKETIKDLKEELKDYKEDVEELHEVRAVVKEPVHESRAAKILFKKVNNMITQLDKVLVDLEQSKKRIKKEEPKAEEMKDQEHLLFQQKQELVHVDELMQTIQKIKELSDDSKLKHIKSVISKIDSDKDGVVSVEDVFKVVEAIGRENVRLTEKQVEDLISLLEKEELISAEEKIEKALQKSIKEAQKQEEAEKAAAAAQPPPPSATSTMSNVSISSTASAASSTAPASSTTSAVLTARKAHITATEELIDKAPQIKDTSKDLTETDKKNISKEMLAKTENIVEPVAAAIAAEKQKEKILPGADISAKISPTIPPPPTPVVQGNPKDKML